MNVYLITLTGQGDTEVKVVDKEAYDWITGPMGERPPGASGWVDPLVPPSQRALIKAARADDDDEIHITIGSWDNDRAMAAESIAPYKVYYTLAEALKAIKARGDDVEDTYEGMIY